MSWPCAYSTFSLPTSPASCRPYPLIMLITHLYLLLTLLKEYILFIKILPIKNRSLLFLMDEGSFLLSQRLLEKKANMNILATYFALECTVAKLFSVTMKMYLCRINGRSGQIWTIYIHKTSEKGWPISLSSILGKPCLKLLMKSQPITEWGSKII